MRISELAERVAVPTSTVRFYERAGLLAEPARTPSGYRDYDEGAASRLLFVTRARRMGLSCEQITELLPIWDGTDCAAAHDAITDLVDAKRAEIVEHIAELQRFADQLDEVRLMLDSSAPPPACRTDLSCCLPEADGAQPAPVALLHRDTARSN